MTQPRGGLRHRWVGSAGDGLDHHEDVAVVAECVREPEAGAAVSDDPTGIEQPVKRHSSSVASTTVGVVAAEPNDESCPAGGAGMWNCGESIVGDGGRWCSSGPRIVTEKGSPMTTGTVTPRPSPGLAASGRPRRRPP